eukprot:3425452-Rhodomonas_salina.1
MSNPGPEHVAAAKRILRYLKGTKVQKLTVTGYVVLLNGAAVSWQSTRQQVTALSTAEAEYYAVSVQVAGTDVTYMRRIMEDLGFKQPEPTVLWEDNMACIYMSQTSITYHKARHIDSHVYHLQELCKDSVLVLEKVSSAEQVADSLTKSTPRPAFEKHRDAMLGVHTSQASDKTQVKSGPDIAGEVDEMEGIELEAEGYEEG